jgi:DNA-binding response OmpR family regulator
MPGDIKKGLKAGFFRYLTKPINLRELVEALEAAARHPVVLAGTSEGPA